MSSSSRLHRTAILLSLSLAAIAGLPVAQSAPPQEPSKTAHPSGPSGPATGDAKLPHGMTRVTSVEGFDEYALANGMHVVMLEDDSKPTTTVNMTVKVGSRYEHYGETGMAHLLEHMMFKGTPHHGAIMTEFQHRGLDANGTTSEDRTNYFASMAESPQNLDWYMHWLADALVNSNVFRKDLDSEMTVVRNEMERGENDPSTVLYFKTLSAAYWWHAYGHVPIGARSDVENVDIAHLQAFYHKYYQPDNAVLIVTGKFDTDATLKLIADTFGKIPRPTRVIEPTYTLDPVQDGEHSVVVRRAGGSPVLYTIYHIPAGSDPRFPAAELATEILGGPELRLTKALVEKGLASDAGADAMSRQEPGTALFEAELNSDQSIDAARDALIATVEGVDKAPFTEEELSRAKNIWLRNFDQLLADPQRLGVSLSEYVAIGDWRLLFLRRDGIKAATLEDVNNFATSFFLRSNRTLGTYIPTENSKRAPPLGRVDVAAELKDYKGQASVAAGEAFDSSPQNLAKRTEFTTVGPVKLGLLPKKSRGAKVVAHVSLLFGDEKSLFGRDTDGSLAAAMLSRGSKRFSREQLANEFEKLGTTWSIEGSAEGTTLSIVTTRANLDAALELGIEVLKTPRFEATEFEQLRSAELQGLQSQADEPETKLSDAIGSYGNTYPRGDVRYSETTAESLEDMKAAKVEGARSFYNDFYGASNAVVSVVGDFDSADIKRLVQKDLVGWDSPKPYQRVPRPWVEIPAKQFKIETKDKQNALMIVKTTQALREEDREFQALRLGTSIFGGGAAGGSRLTDRIRQKDGLSYSIGAFAVGGQFNANATWEAEGIFAPQNEGRVQSDFYDELERARRDGFTQDELDHANASIRSELRLSRAQDSTLTGLIEALIERDKRFDYLDQVQALRDSLSLDEVNAAFRKYIEPNRLIFGVAGDFDAPPPPPAPTTK
jgi:zinc protease